jgi:hypothetical protein
MVPIYQHCEAAEELARFEKKAGLHRIWQLPILKLPRSSAD